MDFKKLIEKGKKTIDDRGGVDSLKADAEELKNIAWGKGSITDKAKEAAEAVKDPGAPGGSQKAGPGKPHGGAGKANGAAGQQGQPNK